MSTRTKFIAAQGDILIQQIAELPRGATPVHPENGRLVVAHGEATGHHHSFGADGAITLFRDDGAGSALFAEVLTPASLEHQEHSTIVLPPGKFRFVRQRTMQSGAIRRVQD